MVKKIELPDIRTIVIREPINISTEGVGTEFIFTLTAS